MLFLEMELWDVVRFLERDTGNYLGSIKYFPRDDPQGTKRITLGFSFKDEIQILRADLSEIENNNGGSQNGRQDVVTETTKS